MSATKSTSKDKSKPKPRGRVWTAEERLAQSKRVKAALAAKKTETVDRLKGVIPVTIPQDVPRVGNYWIWDIEYERIGWRRHITPVTINTFYPWKTYNVPEKLYFGDVLGSTSVEVLHFYVFSLRAKAYVPVYESIYSPWVVREKIKPEHLIKDAERVDKFASTQKVIAGVETQQVLAKLQNAVMLTAHYRERLLETDTNIKDAADDLAAESLEWLLRGKKPPSDMVKWWKKISTFVRRYWYIFTLIGLIGLVYGLILIRNLALAAASIPLLVKKK